MLRARPCSTGGGGTGARGWAGSSAPAGLLAVQRNICTMQRSPQTMRGASCSPHARGGGCAPAWHTLWRADQWCCRPTDSPITQAERHAGRHESRVAHATWHLLGTACSSHAPRQPNKQRFAAVQAPPASIRSDLLEGWRPAALLPCSPALLQPRRLWLDVAAAVHSEHRKQPRSGSAQAGPLVQHNSPTLAAAAAAAAGGGPQRCCLLD